MYIQFECIKYYCWVSIAASVSVLVHPVTSERLSYFSYISLLAKLHLVSCPPTSLLIFYFSASISLPFPNSLISHCQTFSHLLVLSSPLNFLQDFFLHLPFLHLSDHVCFCTLRNEPAISSPIMLLSKWGLPPALQRTHFSSSKAQGSLILKPRPE